MSHIALQEVTLRVEGTPVERSFIGPLTMEATHELAIRSETHHFLGVMAAELVVSLAVADTADERRIVLRNFFSNVDRSTTYLSDDERHSFTTELIETAKQNIDLDKVAVIREHKRLQAEGVDDSYPTTAELEVALLHVTDETVSPPRGIAMEAALKAGHKVLGFVTTGRW